MRKLDDVATKFVSKSVKTVTLNNYEKSWELWNKYISEECRLITNPDLLGINKEVAITIIISFMSYLYDFGYRGARLKSIVSNVKQWMVFKGYRADYFTQPRCLQGLKASRYTNEEEKKK
jgi:hypothetical protein